MIPSIHLSVFNESCLPSLSQPTQVSTTWVGQDNQNESKSPL